MVALFRVSQSNGRSACCCSCRPGRSPCGNGRECLPASVSSSPPTRHAKVDAATAALRARWTPTAGHRRHLSRPFRRTRHGPRRAAARRVAPTPYQRDLSDAHVKRLTTVIEKLDRFLDPLVAFAARRAATGRRTATTAAALKRLGAKASPRWSCPSRPRLPDPRPQHREGPQPAREVARGGPHGARARRRGPAPRPSTPQFEEPALVTLGLCYEQRPLPGGRTPGAAAHRRVPRRGAARRASRAAAPTPRAC